jgi:hypothetical protein
VGNATSCGSDLPPLKSGQQVFILGAGQTDDDDHVEVGFGELVNGFRESEATVHLRSVQPASGTAVGSGSNSGATLHVGDVVRVVRPTHSEGGKHRCGKHRCGTLGPVPLLLPPPPSVPGCRCQRVEGSKLRIPPALPLPCTQRKLQAVTTPGAGSGTWHGERTRNTLFPQHLAPLAAADAR